MQRAPSSCGVCVVYVSVCLVLVIAGLINSSFLQVLQFADDISLFGFFDSQVNSFLHLPT